MFDKDIIWITCDHLLEKLNRLIIELNKKELMTICITSRLGLSDPRSEAEQAPFSHFHPFQVENRLKPKEHNIN